MTARWQKVLYVWAQVLSTAMPANWAVFPHVAQVRLLLAMGDTESALEKSNFVISSLHEAGVRLQLALTSCSAVHTGQSQEGH